MIGKCWKPWPIGCATRGINSMWRPARTRRSRPLAKKNYDLLLVDIRLGDGDGFDLLAHCSKITRA